jgi:hypothetical protein
MGKQKSKRFRDGWSDNREDTHFDSNDNPRTKGIRNPIQQAMFRVNASGGPLRDRRERRPKDARRDRMEFGDE